MFLLDYFDEIKETICNHQFHIISHHPSEKLEGTKPGDTCIFVLYDIAEA